ncbi:MAG: 2-oxoacid:ferredoxin oxidoreductase subunit alpha [Sulfolobaceae archaeon]
MEVSWMIGGAQGTGIDTAASIFANAIGKAGYYLFGNREYYSNIKGRHSYFVLNISDKRVYSFPESVDILATFDAETIFQHFREVKTHFIYNKNLESTKLSTINTMEPEIAEEVSQFLKERGLEPIVSDVVKFLKQQGVKIIPVDYDEIAKVVASKLGLPLSAVERIRNIVAVAISHKLLGLKLDYLIDALKRQFRSESAAKMNIIAAEIGYNLVESEYNLKEIRREEDVVLLDGNTSVAIGKIYAGVRFQSYYPITPASDESVYIEAHQDVMMIDPETGEKRKGTVVVVQAEDEIAAINMAVGAALAGVRASTSTSGPGFSLMVEGLSWAGINEVPIVITYYMRGGPSTGMPTRSSQSDLKFALSAGHGEFPRIVIASGDHVEAFKDTIWAFNLAEKYQVPVIHLLEKALANSFSTVKVSELNLDKIRIERGKRLENPPADYVRFKITQDGISPFAPLGRATVIYNGEEHNEIGHTREASRVRIEMYAKRMRKLEVIDSEIPEEMRLNVFGDDSKIAIVTWGSPKGAVVDALERLRSEGIKVSVIQLRMFNPYPKNLMRKLLQDKEKIIDIENNYMAQSASLMAEYTGITPTNYVLKWNGRMITRDEVINAVKLVLEKNEKRVILSAGA